MSEIKDGEVTTYIRGEDLKEYDILNDVYKGTYGKFRVVSTYKNGVKNGKETIYFDDEYEKDYEHLDEYGCPTRKKLENLIRSEVNYVNGKKEGEYYVNSLDGHYDILASFKNGKLDGIYRTFANGDTSFEVNFVNGKKEGEQIRYYGKLRRGGEGDYEEIYQGIREITNYRNGVKHGKQTDYGGVYVDSYSDYIEKGELLGEANYVNGKLEGYRLGYYSNGNLKEKVFFENGKGEGEWKQYYDTGELASLIHLVHGAYDGEAYEYYKSGNIKRKSNYVKGVQLGLEITYSENGTILKQTNRVLNKDGIRDAFGILWGSLSEEDLKEAEKKAKKEKAIHYLQKGYSIKETAEKLGENEAELREMYGDIYD